MFVSNRMTRHPITIKSSTPVDDAAGIMRRHHFRRLPVVDDGKLVGFLCDKDLMQVMPSPATTLSRYEINSLLDKISVADIMQKKVITVNENATIEEAALIMLNNHISGMPVLTETGKLVGMITESDIFKSLIDVMGVRDGKTRITFIVDDKVGVAKDVADIFCEFGINIDSFVTCKNAHDEYQIIIRCDVDDEGLVKLKESLTSHGYKVTHTIKFS